MVIRLLALNIMEKPGLEKIFYFYIVRLALFVFLLNSDQGSVEKIVGGLQHLFILLMPKLGEQRNK